MIFFILGPDIPCLLIICTCGLWLLLGRKKSKSKTRFYNTKMAICQNCGHQWNA